MHQNKLTAISLAGKTSKKIKVNLFLDDIIRDYV